MSHKRLAIRRNAAAPRPPDFQSQLSSASSGKCWRLLGRSRVTRHVRWVAVRGCAGPDVYAHLRYGADRQGSVSVRTVRPSPQAGMMRPCRVRVGMASSEWPLTKPSDTEEAQR